MVPLEEVIAKEFHETYERLAPEHGYSARKGERVEWAELTEQNKNLMIAVVKDLLQRGVIISV